MNRTPFLLGGITVLLTGCSEMGVTTQPVSLDLVEPVAAAPSLRIAGPGGMLEIGNPSLQGSSRISMDLTMPDGSVCDLSIRPIPESPDHGNGPIGIAVVVEDQAGQLLWWTSWEESGGAALVREKTATDSLSIRRESAGGGGYREWYTLNGSAREVSFDPRSPVPSADPAFADYLTGGPTLYGNPYGAAAMTIVSSPEFDDWIRHSMGTSGVEAMGKGMDVAIRNPMQLICGIASVCSFKCFFGGLVNPLCIACTGVGVACGIYDIWCFITGCD